MLIRSALTHVLAVLEADFVISTLNSCLFPTQKAAEHWGRAFGNQMNATAAFLLLLLCFQRQLFISSTLVLTSCSLTGCFSPILLNYFAPHTLYIFWYVGILYNSYSHIHMLFAFCASTVWKWPWTESPILFYFCINLCCYTIIMTINIGFVSPLWLTLCSSSPASCFVVLNKPLNCFCSAWCLQLGPTRRLTQPDPWSSPALHQSPLLTPRHAHAPPLQRKHLQAFTLLNIFRLRTAAGASVTWTRRLLAPLLQGSEPTVLSLLSLLPPVQVGPTTAGSKLTYVKFSVFLALRKSPPMGFRPRSCAAKRAVLLAPPGVWHVKSRAICFSLWDGSRVGP